MFKKLDKGILYTTLFLTFSGFLIFLSAALSDLKNPNFFFSIFTKQLMAMIIGIILMLYIATSKNFFSADWIRAHSIKFFIFGLVIQLAVLIPGLGLSFKGGQRWLDLGFLTIQPSEFFKYTFIIFLSAILIAFKKELRRFKNFLIFIFIIFSPIIVFYFLIHDFGTLASILFASLFLMILSGLRYRYIFIPVVFFIVMVLPLLYYFVPYVHDRLEVFINPESADVLGEGYQLNQSLITIGSGQIFGRGFGGSLQKFKGYIPEPLGDSIFAVFAEEFGFLGSVFLIFAFLILIFFIFKTAEKIKKPYGRSLVAALGVLVVFPAFYNIGAALGAVPLSGMPITFVSKGGSSLVAALIAIGLILRLGRKR